ncbi:SAM-dependent methyltransferase [Gordonia sp. DT218]|uniref:SAM-dependent methyltransferase n=1 Tax=Gordonia sp. DT218 TaxID=3416659 RepID=UPI003CE87DB3
MALTSTESDKIADIYDRFTSVDVQGSNLHFGYWDDPRADIAVEDATDRLTDLLVQRLDIGPDSHVLDVGCGVGGPALRIAKTTGARVTGISISQEQVAMATALADSEGLSARVSFHQEDATQISWPPESFDAAVAVESMMHMPDREDVFARIGHALRPGGQLVMTDTVLRAPVPADKQAAVDRFFSSFGSSTIPVEQYVGLLQRSGFWFDEIVDVSTHTIHKAWQVLAARIVELRPQLEALYDADMVRAFDPSDLLDVPQIGYMIIAAHRPRL